VSRRAFALSRRSSALLLVLPIFASSACGSTQAHDPPARPVAFTHAFRFFSPSSFWNTPVAPDAAIDPQSAGLVAALNDRVDEEERTADGPWINTTAYSVPLYTVSAKQPTVTVHLRNHRPERSLSAAWRAVPLPANARPATGSDGTLAVWQPSSGRLWEFWRLVDGARGWQASWGGAMRHVARQQGVYGPGVWPHAHRWWGVSASSLSLLGGLMTIQQLQSGEIDHALAIALPEIRAGVHASPAQRSDGESSEATAMPEGAHLRLNPALDLTTLHLPPLTLSIARAAQRYGIFVTDRSPIAEIYAQDPTPSGANPYLGAHGLFGAEDPRPAMAAFPWSQLQVLQLSLHNNRNSPGGGGL
jgi:hypothetical protein